jgi:Colicin E5 ribonuclease domain
LAFLPLGRFFNAWRSWIVKPEPEWTLGTYKSPQKWANQLEGRDWTPKQISDTIKNGEQFPAPNAINKGNPATRYQTSVPGRYVVRDDITKEILQVGKEGFNPPVIK